MASGAEPDALLLRLTAIIGAALQELDDDLDEAGFMIEDMPLEVQRYVDLVRFVWEHGRKLRRKEAGR